MATQSTGTDAETRPEDWREGASAGDPRAQFELGKAYLREENLSRGRRWLARAAENGSAGAACELGLLHMLGRSGMPISPPDAAPWLRRAAELGHGEAMTWLAQFSFTGYGTERDHEAARQWLLKAAKAGNAHGLRQLGFVYARLEPAATWQPRAFACLERAAQLGDDYAAYACGIRLIEGRGVEADSDAGNAWLARAAHAGIYLAVQRHSESGDGTGHPERGTSDPPVADFTWPAPRQAQLERLSEQPPVFKVSNLIEKEMREYLINRAQPFLAPARTVDPQSGEVFHSKIRTNSNVGFLGDSLDIATHLVELDMTHLAQADVNCAERMAMLRYGPGEEYKPHYDYVSPHAKNQIDEYRERGQRLKTIFAYLNDVPAGGETDFPRLGISLKPKAGGGVMFHNTTPEGRPLSDTLHAGCPVIEGEKWLATLWIRERPVTYR